MCEISHSVSPEQCAGLQLVLDKDRNSSITQLASGLYGEREEYFIGAYDDDRLVGLAVLVGAGALEMELYKLYVHPDHRGKNIASSLVNEVLRFLKDNNFKCLAVEISPSGWLFWEKYKHSYKYSFDGSRLAIWFSDPPSWLDEIPEIQKSWIIPNKPETQTY